MDDTEKEKTIHNLQMLEQNLQHILLQKQAFQMELHETQSAMKEIEKSGEDIFKIIGQLMIKTEKEKVKEDLLGKKKFLEIRLKNIEKQEISLSQKLEETRKEIISDVSE